MVKPTNDVGELRKQAIKASTHAYSPYSKAQVGSALETSSGELFYGCNVENSSYGGTVCAERVALWKAVSEGHRKIKRIYIYTRDGWPPCGMCRQVLSEFSDETTEVIIGDEKGNERKMLFTSLLPEAFGPNFLNK